VSEGPTSEERALATERRAATMGRFRQLRRRRFSAKAGIGLVALALAAVVPLVVVSQPPSHSTRVLIAPPTSSASDPKKTGSSDLPTTTLPPGSSDSGVDYPPFPRGVQDLGCLNRTAGLTQPEANQIAQDVSSAVGNQLRMLAPCPTGPVIVGLAPGNEALASRLFARYGQKIDIEMGLTHFDGSPGRSPKCGPLPSPVDPSPGLGVSLRAQLGQSTVKAGQDFSGKVVVTVTEGHLAMDTGQPLEAVLVQPGTRRVVGVGTSAIGGTGYGFDLSAAGSWSVDFVGGTARCDGGTGSALPAGIYEVIVRLAPETTPHSPVFWTPPVTIRLR
jgi:hypothetical protein